MRMLTQQLAKYTALRDGDSLDMGLVQLIQQMGHVDSVILLSAWGNAGPQQRALLRYMIHQGQLQAVPEPMWVDFDRVPLLYQLPRHVASIEQKTIEQFTAEDGSCVTVVPLSGTQGQMALEISCANPPNPSTVQDWQDMFRIGLNLHELMGHGLRDTLTGLLTRKSFEDRFYKASLAPLPMQRMALGYVQKQTASLEIQPNATALELFTQSATKVLINPVTTPRGYWLAVLDVDHFKRVNDTYGHVIGDEVLLRLARLMQSSFRPGDWLFRFGGEEFVVLLRCATAQGASKALNRLRKSVEAYAFPQAGHITVSAGFTRIRAGDSPTQTFERADRAVYDAKNSGRNCVRFDEELSSATPLPQEPAPHGSIDLF